MKAKTQHMVAENKNMPTYCENIRKTRLSRGFTQKNFAERVGISRATYSRLEGGGIVLTVDRLLEIAAALHVSAGVLLGEARTSTLTLAEEALLADYRDCDERGRRIIELTARAERELREM